LRKFGEVCWAKYEKTCTDVIWKDFYVTYKNMHARAIPHDGFCLIYNFRND
jgi:hypothetical protein